MKNKKGLLIILVLFAFTVLTSFKMFIPHENLNHRNWIPEDFDPQKCTLLIEKHPLNEKYNNGMIEYLQKEYPWKFEVATYEDIKNNSKYQDKKIYQFVVLWEDINVKNPYTTERSIITYHDLEGHFWDRSTDKQYSESGYSLNRGMTAYKKIISELVDNFKDKK